MSKFRQLAYGAPVPLDWFDALSEFLGPMVTPTFVVSALNTTTVQVVAGTDNDQVAIGVSGKWRWNTATATAAHPGGGAGTYDVWVLASANVFTPGGVSGEIDTTDYTFGLKIQAGGSAAPTGTYNARAIAHTRKVATLAWDGAAITSVTQLVGPTTITPASGHFVGESIIWHGFSLPTWVAEVWGWTDGSAVLRSTYAVLLAKITSTQSGTRASGSTVITALSSTVGLGAGCPVEGTGIPAGTTISTVDSLAQVTLSAAATSAGTSSMTFFPWGNGNGSTTFNLPDSRGRAWFGLAMSGGHLDMAGMGKTEGVAVAFRRAKHRHTNGSALSGAPAIGSLAISGAPAIGSLVVTGAPALGSLALPNHVQQAPGGNYWKQGAGSQSYSPVGGGDGFAPIDPSGNPTSLPPITGAPALGSLAVGGAPAAGSLAVGGAPSAGSLAVSGLVGNNVNDVLDSVPYGVVAMPIRMA